MLDPTCGSGSALRAAQFLISEEALGLEVDSDFAALARLAQWVGRSGGGEDEVRLCNPFGPTRDLRDRMWWLDRDDDERNRRLKMKRQGPETLWKSLRTNQKE